MEPIAVVGIGCRFPGGAATPAAFWTLLLNGVDAVGELPTERWNWRDYPEHPELRFGGFLRDIDRFDASFFEIAPREAACMDPQQRLLMEVAWESIEDAGMRPSSLAGSNAGVFLGIYNDDYARFQQTPERLAECDLYSGTGTSHSVASGRLSYFFDFRGPGVSLDCACSSSLMAVNLACQSLLSGESDMALAGGVNLILTPVFGVMVSRMGILAPDGRCKAFDARANGFVRSEGCGIVVLKRLSDAERDGDPVRAVILGCAANQDGRSNGLTASNGLAQIAVIRRALEIARVNASDVSFVEAHGTGTALGDPIEADALLEVYGRDRRPGDVFRIGSLKANLGHMEAAAGIAGFIKTVLAVQRRTIPPQLHFTGWNPHIDVADVPVEVAIRATPWERKRLAGVSAFGWSGTNVHAILSPAPERVHRARQISRPMLLPFSAKTPAATDALRTAYAEAVGNTRWDDFCAMAQRREHHSVRGFVTAASSVEAEAALRAWRPSERGPVSRGNLAWVFPGQGSQWLGMGRDLMAEEAVFANAIRECEAALAAHAPWKLSEQLESDTVSRIDIVQPMLFSMQVALVALWRSWGIEADSVVGHSMGEVAAAYTAGILSLTDAACIICRRSRLLLEQTGKGSMLLVELPRDEAAERVWPLADRISVAASNSPKLTVLSGDTATLNELAADLELEQVFHRWIKVDVASHSPQMDGLCKVLQRDLSGVAPRKAQIPFYSTVYGKQVDGRELDADYWVRNLREPVLFADAARELIQCGFSHFLEISPHPVLLPAIEDCGAAAVLPSMRRDEPGFQCMLDSLGSLYQDGFEFARPERGGHVELPPYPWQRERHWIERVIPTSSGASEFFEIAWRDRPLVASGGGDTGFRVEGESALAEALRHLLPAGNGESVVYMGNDPGELLGIVRRAPFRLVLAGSNRPEIWPLAGFARVLLTEAPELRCKLIEGTDPREIAAEILSNDSELQVAWREGRRFVARLTKSSAPVVPCAVRGDAAYLITGGFGGVGQCLRRWLIAHGARHVVITGRSASTGVTFEDDARVFSRRCDTGDFGALHNLFAEFGRELPPLKGVFHAAAVLDDALIQNLLPRQFGPVLRPKVEGGWNLHLLTKEMQLDHFVLFSSASAIVGNPGQANYAAANAYLDGLAHYRRGLGLAALSINWGPWAGTGRVDAGVEERLEHLGLAAAPAERQLDALGSLMGSGVTQAAVMRFDFARWSGAFPQSAQAAFFDELRCEEPAAELRPRNLAELEQHVLQQMRRVLRRKEQRLDANAPLRQLGMDSLMGLELRNRLERTLGLNLPATLVWTWPTRALLTAHLAERLGFTDPAPAPQQAGYVPSARSALFAGIGGMGDDEVRKLLANER